MDLLAAWDNAQASIKNKIGDSSYTTWFSNIKASNTGSTLTLATPDEFFKNWIEEHYLDLVRETIREQGGGDCQIDLSIADPIITKQPTPVTPPPPTATINISNNQVIRALRHSNIQSRFNFDNFVIGSSNRFACAASQAVANAPAKAYNPLFIYGQSGLGKTHLMQAIANHITKTAPHTHCLYLTSEQFTNELISAIQHGTTNEFKQKYRYVDVLLIDDIQFIAGRKATQEEFFHTFNSLHDSKKQIVISSDRPPKEISNLEERLISRFMWGLITDIQPPDFETRVAILRKKTSQEDVKIPEDVIYFIAEQIKTNIRELEGALIRVVAYSLLEEKPISLSLAQTVLKDMVKETTKTISLEMIIQTVCDYFRINMDDLRSKKKTQTIVLPRQIAMFLARKLTKHSLPEIGNAFGGRDHTTVLHSCNKIEEAVHNNNEIKFSVDKLLETLKR